MLVAVVRDTSDRSVRDEERDWLERNDRVTGLPLRASILESMESARRRTGVVSGSFLVVDLVDVDAVGRTLGSEVVDVLVTGLADRLVGWAFPHRGLVGRLGRDQFVVYLPDIGDPASLALCSEQVAAISSRPLILSTAVVSTDVVVGARCADPADDTAADVLSVAIARAAMAVRRTRPEHPRFTTSGRYGRGDLGGLVGELDGAIERGELWLAYQPIVDCATGRLRAAEALLRWNHPDLGEVGPAAFVPAAEESGLIVDIGRWVIAEACRQMAAWEADGQIDAGFQVAVNVSTRQLRDPDIVDDIAGHLAAASLPPSRLLVEVTESLAMENLDRCVDVLRSIAALGVPIALDDFGTGYSSLAQIGNLPVDEIKIDRAFIAGLGTDAGAQAIVDAIVGIARSLGITVVAEGVERPVQLDRLRTMGCDLAQGWLFAAAQPPEAFLQDLRRIDATAGDRHVASAPPPSIR